ncbi:hypothetical protein [Streptomyces sp. ISL-11]|uniref:hypothetical protein n=1 Tax=Streptomyces sp. ISL-11 TaxID=2819174 RepID=UPI001BE5D194|nr:hypothetical protein [Streptomyces sp. ISL-11]MBT2385522.1 hypothetical protein [Streptomyces sp. ISL-11]
MRGDEEASRIRVRAGIALGTAAIVTVWAGFVRPGETKSQKAEHVYLAHQKAGVELKKPDLARWAGYKQEGFGRTQYAKLDKLHGPIVVCEEGDQLNLDRQQQDTSLSA